jgi:hypothetical protein
MKVACPRESSVGLNGRDGRPRFPPAGSRRRSRAVSGLQRRAGPVGGPLGARLIAAGDRGRVLICVGANGSGSERRRSCIRSGVAHSAKSRSTASSSDTDPISTSTSRLQRPSRPSVNRSRFARTSTPSSHRRRSAPLRPLNIGQPRGRLPWLFVDPRPAASHRGGASIALDADARRPPERALEFRVAADRDVVVRREEVDRLVNSQLPLLAGETARDGELNRDVLDGPIAARH